MHLHRFCSKIPFDGFRNISHQATQLILQKLCPEPTVSNSPMPFPSKEPEDIKHKTGQVLSSRTWSTVQGNRRIYLRSQPERKHIHIDGIQECPWTVCRYHLTSTGSEEAKALTVHFLKLSQPKKYPRSISSPSEEISITQHYTAINTGQQCFWTKYLDKQ